MIRRFLYNFFRGRNGVDQLAMAAWVASLVFLLLSLFGGAVGVLFNFLTLAAMVYAWFRALSRNVGKRSQENARYLSATAGIRRKLRNLKTRFAQRKDFKFFTCPTCHTLLRVPRGKGKIQITCRKCGNRFSGKT